MLGPASGAAQGGGGDTARRRFIGGGRVPRFHNSIPPSKQNSLGKSPARARGAPKKQFGAPGARARGPLVCIGITSVVTPTARK